MYQKHHIVLGHHTFSIKIQAVSTSREPDMKYEILEKKFIFYKHYLLRGEAVTNMQGF